MSQEPLISIIVPVYKTAKFLPQCIDSILAQTYKNLEIILIDDGSPDNSGEICDRYAAQDKRVVVIHKPNGGVSSARNAGLKIAKGEYIGFCDSDDFIDADTYRFLYDLIMREKTDLAMCNMYVEIDGQWKVTPQIREEKQKVQGVSLLNIKPSFYLMNKLYAQAVLKGYYFEEGISYGEDSWFLFHVLQQNISCVISNEPKYHYRDNTKGATHTFHKEHLSHLQKCEQFMAFAQQHQLTQFYQHVYWGHLECVSAWLGWLALEEKPDKKAAELLLSYVRHNGWGILRHKKIKWVKKCFLFLACVNFAWAAWLAKKIYKG